MPSSPPKMSEFHIHQTALEVTGTRIRGHCEGPQTRAQGQDKYLACIAVAQIQRCHEVGVIFLHTGWPFSELSCLEANINNYFRPSQHVFLMFTMAN